MTGGGAGAAVDPKVKDVDVEADADAAGLLSPPPNIGGAVLPPPNENAGVLLKPAANGCVAGVVLFPPNINPLDAGAGVDVDADAGVLLLFPNIPPGAAFCVGVLPNKPEPIWGWPNIPPLPFVLLGVDGASDPNGFILGCSGAPLLPKPSALPVAFPPKEGVDDAAFGVPNPNPAIPPSAGCCAFPLDPKAGLGVPAKKLGILDPPPRAPVAAPPRPRPFFKGAILYPSAKRSQSGQQLKGEPSTWTKGGQRSAAGMDRRMDIEKQLTFGPT